MTMSVRCLAAASFPKGTEASRRLALTCVRDMLWSVNGIDHFHTRRRFLAAGAFATAIPGLLDAAASTSEQPWHRRVLRWGQTNINEFDPERYDLDWWRRHWRRTETQGVVINAAGIVAYYPSRFELQYRAQFLKGRDLYGEVTRAAHEDGLVVFARMDSNRATEEFYRAHPDWFAVDADGEPYRAADRYITCIDSPYYDEYLPDVLREVIEWERPEGFTDNSWSGLNRDQICYCRYSRDSFRAATGLELPVRKDWDDPAYRQWIEWSYARRVAVWELNNRVTRAAGGEDCLWVGMLGGDFVNQGQRFRDVKAITERSEMIMLDDQGRSEWIGFHENAEMGKRLHGLLGWDKTIPESMATYQRDPVFRKAAATKPESRMWMWSGFAGGIQPWWHHVGAYQWDRRQFQTPIPVNRWHEANERYLVNRRPVASVGVVYSQRNADFYGRDNAHELVAHPYYGFIQALVRARIPYLPVHADHIERDSAELPALILPNLATMNDSQLEAVRRYARSGGSLIATGETSLYDRWGDARDDFALSGVFGVHAVGKRHGSLGSADSWSGGDHSYLRLRPPIGGEVYGPKSGEEPVVSRPRHSVLAGFEQTDIVGFGGLLVEVRSDPGATVPLTLIPDFPAYPPETSWMRTPRTDIAALVLGEESNGARRAWLAADLDRRFSRDNLPDHGRLLANLVRWVAKDWIPLRVKGRGLIDCHLYRQEDRLILHLVNVTSAGTWRTPVHELIPVGPIEVQARVPPEVRGSAARCLVSRATLPAAHRDHWTTFKIPRILDHEVVVIE